MNDFTFFHVLAGLSGLFWTLCYCECIRVGFRDRVCAMPVEALALNFCWEIAFGFFWHPVGWADYWQTWINTVWGCFDVLILATFFLYGSTRGATDRQFKAYGTAVLVTTALIFGALFYVAADQGPEGVKRLHEVTAFGVNVPMSALFIRMLWTRGGPAGQNLNIAVSKFLGTGVVTVGFTLYGGFAAYPVILTCGWTCAVLDAVYIYLLWRATR